MYETQSNWVSAPDIAAWIYLFPLPSCLLSLVPVRHTSFSASFYAELWYAPAFLWLHGLQRFLQFSDSLVSNFYYTLSSMLIFLPYRVKLFFNFVHLLLVCQKIPFNFISFYTFYRIIVILVRHDHMVVKQTEASWPGPLRSGSALEAATPPPANFPKFERSQLSV